ncbi:MAG: YqeG family HAD IIIA-type phosphatase [Candidatus Eremiobacteraeota bacterium]|nr:YqeG family HAD IIIA-type phosphatase [Candidatus Eremiobacteraeota bacterium]
MHRTGDNEENSGEETLKALGKASLMFGPDRFAPRLCDVSLQALSDHGICGLILDLDNTMVAYRQSEVVKDHLAWVEDAHERGFKMVMLSNNFTDRVTTVADQLGIECIPNALKPLPSGFLRAKRLLGLKRREIAVVGDQLFTDVLGAKLCGFYTILTEPIEPHDFAITRVFRFFERLMLPHRNTP